MENWYEKSIKALQLNGMAERTQEGYTRTVRMLTEHYDKTPDLITEEELQEYFLHRKNVSTWSPNTMRICYSGIKFFFVNASRLPTITPSSPRSIPAVSGSRKRGTSKLRISTVAV